MIRIVIIILLFSFRVYSQDSLYTRYVINSLCSEKYHGRGYVKQGDKKAATFIYSELKSFNIPSKKQEFRFPVNTFPKFMDVMIDGKALVAGKDYIVHPASGSIHKKFSIEKTDSSGILQAYIIISQYKIFESV